MDDEQASQTEDEVRSRARAKHAMRPRRRSLAIIAALASGVALLVLALVLASGRTDLRRNVAASPTPAPTDAAPVASPSASASPSPEPTAPSPIPTGRPAGGIEAYPLGALRGEYAFVLNGGAITMPGTVAEVWAVPLAGGPPRLAARYVNATTPATSTGENVLARQFSPDGRRLVLSAAMPRAQGGERLSLFIVDLETARVTPVGAEDAADHERPAWSPDGRRIAYVKRPIIGAGTTASGSDEGIWVMNVDGSGARKVALPPAPAGMHFPAQTYLHSWTPDGRLAWFYQAVVTLTLTDIDSGAHTEVRPAVGDVRGISFRTAVPRIAGSFSDRPGNCPGHYVAVLDGAPERILVRAPERPQCPLRIHDVRWNPTRDEILYILESTTNELHVHGLSGATHRVVSGADAVLAEWSSAGTHLLYIHRNAPDQVGRLPLRGGELRSVLRDGSDDRTLFAPRAPAALSEIAVRLYPQR